jgi:putative transcription factor
MNHQDWKDVVFKKPEKKQKKPHFEKSKIQKQLEEDDIPKLKNFGKDNGKLLQQARMIQKLTQEQLAKDINEQKNLINQYESGNIIPDNKVVSKLQRKLNIKFIK